MEGNFLYEAHCRIDGEEAFAAYTAAGEWRETELEIPLDEIPAPVRAAFDRTRPRGVLKEAARVEISTGETRYGLEYVLEGAFLEAYYAPDGQGIFPVGAPTVIVPAPDSTKLPFAISGEKRLSDEDLANKREGGYITGAPDISADPINGLGYGGEGSVYFNGKRSDPFFEYTPCRAKLDVVLFNTTRSQR